jgi:hypothetical protein
MVFNGTTEENHDLRFRVDIFHIQIMGITAKRDLWDGAEQDGSTQPCTNRSREEGAGRLSRKHGRDGGLYPTN